MPTRGRTAAASADCPGGDNLDFFFGEVLLAEIEEDRSAGIRLEMLDAVLMGTIEVRSVEIRDDFTFGEVVVLAEEEGEEGRRGFLHAKVDSKRLIEAGSQPPVDRNVPVVESLVAAATHLDCGDADGFDCFGE